MPTLIVPSAATSAKAVGVGRRVVLTGSNVVGNLAALVLTLAPVFTFAMPIWNENAVGDRTVYGHVATLFTSVACFLYGLPSYPDGFVSLAINITSVVLQLGYIAVFIWFAAGVARRRALYLLATILIMSTIITSLALTKVVAASFVPIVAMATTSFNYISVGVDVVKVARNGRVENLDPIAQILLGLTNAFASAVFSFFSTPKNLYIAVLTTVGVAVMMAQLAVYVIHSNQEPEAEPDAEPVQA
ncbi:hypothetical protein ACQJBY_020080 [Aegilops geniculata]